MTLFNYILSWWPVLAGLGGLAGLAAWFLGLPTLFKLLDIVLDTIGPILKAVGAALAMVLGWLWETILWPGIKDILDTWTTIVTVFLMMGTMFLLMKANDDIRIAHKGRELASCQMALVKAKRPLPRPEAAPPIWEFRFPWDSAP